MLRFRKNTTANQLLPGDKAFDRTEANVGFANWITSITIPDTVTSIGKNAFYGCTRLESITLPEGLESIGDEAFRHCNSLKKIEIPASVTSIGDLAFKQAGGAHLAEINVAADNKNYSSIDGVLFSKDGKTLICYPTGKVGLRIKCRIPQKSSQMMPLRGMQIQ